MKKSCLFALGIIPTLVGGANAATIKEICQSNPDKFVWVEKTSDCATLRPCADPSQPHYNFYCNRKFADIQVASIRDAQELANLYVQKAMKLSGGCSFLLSDEAAKTGQDFIRCKTPDGGFVEFEFDDYSESNEQTAEYSYDVGRCIAYGGTVDTRYTSDAPIKWAMIGATGTAPLMEPLTSGVSLAINAGKTAEGRDAIACFNVTEAQCSEMYFGKTIYYNAEQKACLLNR